MEPKSIIVIVLVAAIATLIPRFLPYFSKSANNLPYFIKSKLELLPVAALGALIFPYAILDFHTIWYAGLCGVIASFILGYLKRSMIVSILASIVVTYLFLVI
ncbi:MAG: AzlD domain-containing protein [Spirochaetaceae bacterium]|nr:AzlD domain-containing protein [Spirochaetaceae bacterium]